MVQLWDDTDDEALLQQLTGTLESMQMSKLIDNNINDEEVHFWDDVRRPCLD
jgi:hypothetical protein